jgi:hypothetical protein
MKKITALYAVTAIAALSIAGQAFAKGGSMGGNQGRSSMAPQMTTAQPAAGAGSMQHGSMQGTAPMQGTTGTTMQGAMTGTAAKGMPLSGTGSAAGHQPGMPVTTAKPASNP